MEKSELKELEVNKTKFAHYLVNPEKEVRDKTLRDFKQYLTSLGSIDNMGMLKVTKCFIPHFFFRVDQVVGKFGLVDLQLLQFALLHL
jgi:hypothetical protein